ncbi:hypothetical protein [Planococcus sp. CAU13]|uniref:hypothetical protein n=1 Tax=Planococcus sp. CAU13 TaxID=1541197 RepID=UPI00052FF17F|nr:hypothetical protein [Planococcus sp. CAU13]
MKLITRSLIGATALFGIYTAGTLVSGYIKTKNYEPDFEAAWTNAEMLSSEVAFGHTASFASLAGLFGVTVLLCAALLVVYDKFKSARSSDNKLSR